MRAISITPVNVCCSCPPPPPLAAPQPRPLRNPEWRQHVGCVRSSNCGLEYVPLFVAPPNPGGLLASEQLLAAQLQFERLLFAGPYHVTLGTASTSSRPGVPLSSNFESGRKPQTHPYCIRIPTSSRLRLQPRLGGLHPGEMPTRARSEIQSLPHMCRFCLASRIPHVKPRPA